MSPMSRFFHIVSFLLLVGFFLSSAAVAENCREPGHDLWPKINPEAKPGAYWWWMGSAVDKPGLEWNIEKTAENGLGTLHIIPIYGLKNNEENELEFMSPEWLEMLKFTIETARKRGLEIDMTLGTGWCFGGPEVGPDEGNMLASFKKNAEKQIELQVRRRARAVKRAAPGGAGSMLDPFSDTAIRNYLDFFDTKLKNYDGPLPRAVYHDSYEYAANWSDELYSRFKALNGYDLDDNLDVFLYAGKDDDSDAADRVRRVKADYRRTLSEMHLSYTEAWTAWAKEKKLLSRNEAHGSPSNWLDVYAAAEIPETEFFRNDKNPLISKFASSAAHVTGKRLVASESGTWAAEHFNETLGGLKVLFDGFFLSGVNHIFYHGMIYSPENAEWPGWSFYASTQMNPRNTIWDDAKYLNEYIARVQSFLQAGVPDSEVLLLWSPEDV